MSKTRDYGIRIWFWQRDDPTVPPEISHGASWRGDVLIDMPNPTWGEPAAYFPLDPSLCNYDQYFNAHAIVFDLTFCVRDFSTGLLYFLNTTEVFYRVIGPAVIGPQPAVVPGPAKTVSIHWVMMAEFKTHPHRFVSGQQ